jgi:hypothetical protein
MDPKELGSDSHEKQNKKTPKTYLLKIVTKAIVFLSNKSNDFVVITFH